MELVQTFIIIMSLLIVIMVSIIMIGTDNSANNSGLDWENMKPEPIVKEYPLLVGYDSHEQLVRNSIKSIENPELLSKLDSGISYNIDKTGLVTNFKSSETKERIVDFEIAKRIAETAGNKFKYVAIAAINDGKENVGGHVYIMREYIPKTYISVSTNSNKCNYNTSMTCGYSKGADLEMRKYAVYQLFA